MKKTDKRKKIKKGQKRQKNKSPDKKNPPQWLNNPLIRACGALLLAVVLLGITNFSFITLIQGAKEVHEIQGKEGAFVKRDIFAILGFYREDAHGRYAVVPMGNEFVTVLLPRRYFQSANTVFIETLNYIDGGQSVLDKYFVVEGMVSTLTGTESAALYDWFGANKDWMFETGTIAYTDDYADYLSDYVLLVDIVNNRRISSVLILTGLAAACLIYALFEVTMTAAKKIKAN